MHVCLILERIFYHFAIGPRKGAGRVRTLAQRAILLFFERRPATLLGERAFGLQSAIECGMTSIRSLLFLAK